MHPSFRYVHSLIASLALALTAGAGALGCAEDCSYAPSQCPFVAAASLCTASAPCTVDGVAVSADGGRTSFDLSQKLVIPLAAAKVTTDMPDLLIHVETLGGVTPSEVLVSIDGVALTPEAEPYGPDIRVRWVKGAEAPKELEIGFTKPGGAVKVTVTFSDIACQEAETAACHGGGE